MQRIVFLTLLTLVCVACIERPRALPPAQPMEGMKFAHAADLKACSACHATDPLLTTQLNQIRNQMDHAFADLPDCANCHGPTAAASDWKSWRLSATLNGDANSKTRLGPAHAGFDADPSSCITCHSNERPDGRVGLLFFSHTGRGATGDCKSCHTQNIGLSWKVRIF